MKKILIVITIVIISIIAIDKLFSISPIISEDEKGKQLQQNINFRELENLGGKHIKPKKITTNNINIRPQGKLYLDDGVDTYISEISGDVISFYTGATPGLTVSSTKIYIPATNRLYLDGGYNTYITEVSADRVAVYAGSNAVAFFDSNDGGGGVVQLYCYGEVNALSYVDRTPYPKNTEEAYTAIKSIKLKEDGSGVDHNLLSPFIQSISSGKIVGRDLSATVSAQNEVIKDLIKRIEALEK